MKSSQAGWSQWVMMMMMMMNKYKYILPHDAFPPRAASRLWETCPGSPLDGLSRTWKSPQSPPCPPRVVAPSLPVLAHPWKSPPCPSGGQWWQWSPPRPPGWTWSWPSCWNTCARCPGGFLSCRPRCPAPAPPPRLCSAEASSPQAPSGAGTDTGSKLWHHRATVIWMDVTRNGNRVHCSKHLEEHFLIRV